MGVTRMPLRVALDKAVLDEALDPLAAEVLPKRFEAHRAAA
jgi:hypothetical protein